MAAGKWVDVSSFLVFYLKESEWHQRTCGPKKKHRNGLTENIYVAGEISIPRD